MNRDIKIINMIAYIYAGVGAALIVFSVIMNAFGVFNVVSMITGIVVGVVICIGCAAIEAFTFDLDERRRKSGRRKNIRK